MSYHTYQDPVQTKEDKNGDHYAHPAFAQIGASRCSGGAHLYGSDFQHHHYITIRIKGSELVRSLSNEWHFGKQSLIEVAMSEAQWATFVSSLNMGDGVPCTLQHIQGKPVPQLTPPAKTTEKFSADMKKIMAEAQEELQKVSEALTEGNIGKTRARELQKRLQLVSSRLTGSAGFVADQFDEHMESTVEKAKVEVNAYAIGVVQRAGLDALGINHEAVSLEYSDNKGSV